MALKSILLTDIVNDSGVPEAEMEVEAVILNVSWEFVEYLKRVATMIESNEVVKSIDLDVDIEAISHKDFQGFISKFEPLCQLNASQTDYVRKLPHTEIEQCRASMFSFGSDESFYLRANESYGLPFSVWRFNVGNFVQWFEGTAELDYSGNAYFLEDGE